MDTLRLSVKLRPEKDCADETLMTIPVVAPHRLTRWLLDQHKIRFCQASARRFWDHHRAHGVPWMQTCGFQNADFAATFQPFALYGDEAEYTITKEKILVIFVSHWPSIALDFLYRFTYDP